MIRSRVKSLGYAAAIALVSASAQAVIVDGWQLNTTLSTLAPPSNTTNIGHLNLSGGNATVNQEVNGISMMPFVGAGFREFGEIFSITYTAENCVGACDSGVPVLLSGAPAFALQLKFTDLAGVVTGFNPITGALTYRFTPGVGTVVLGGTTTSGSPFTNLANLQMGAPSGGGLNSFLSSIQSNGQSTITAKILAAGYTTGLLKDSLGVNFDPTLLLADIETTNKISSAATLAATCTFDLSKMCVSIGIRSDGSLDLTVPEPGMLALLGIAMAGLGFVARRKRAA